MFTTFNRFEIQMTLREAESVSHCGECEPDVLLLLESSRIKRQFKKIDPEKIREELDEQGVWGQEELQDDAKNQVRILWIAGNNIVEEYHSKRSDRTHTLYKCGACGNLHRWNFNGDCREDKNRFADEQDYAKRMHVGLYQIELRSMEDRTRADETTQQ